MRLIYEHHQDVIRAEILKSEVKAKYWTIKFPKLLQSACKASSHKFVMNLFYCERILSGKHTFCMGCKRLSKRSLLISSNFALVKDTTRLPFPMMFVTLMSTCRNKLQLRITISIVTQISLRSACQIKVYENLVINMTSFLICIAITKCLLSKCVIIQQPM